MKFRSHTKTSSPAKKVVVVGAGISGLSAAYYFRKHGFEVEVIEREKSVGGMVRSVLKEDNYLIDLGPCAFCTQDESIVRLAGDLSIKHLMVGDEKISGKIYTWRDGKLRSPRRGRLSKISEIFFPPNKDRTAEKSGEVIPIFTSSYNLQDLRYSFKWGMGTLTARLEEELRSRIKTGISVSSIERRKDGGLKLYVRDQVVPIDADIVFLAVPAFTAAKLLRPLEAEICELLASIPYSPIFSVHTAYNQKDVPRKLDAFGIKIPEDDGDVKLLGTIWSSSVFPNRCPKGEVLFMNYIGGLNDPQVADLPDEDIIREVQKGLKDLMGIDARLKYAYVKRFSQAFPNHFAGYESTVEKVKLRLEGLPGIHLAGSFISGVSVASAISFTREAVDKIAGDSVGY